jgi:hypothetical protein
MLLAILFVADLFHPVHGLAIEPFLNGDVRHGGGGCGAVPVLLTRRKPDDVARPNLLDRASPALRQPGAAVTISVWPSGWVCHAVRERGAYPASVLYAKGDCIRGNRDTPDVVPRTKPTALAIERMMSRLQSDRWPHRPAGLATRRPRSAAAPCGALERSPLGNVAESIERTYRG